MKANELMIGDWVLYEGSPREIALLDDAGCALLCPGENAEILVERDLQPISLTPEILDKNGFEPTSAPSERVWKHNGQEVWLDNEGKNYWANIKNGEFYFEGYIEHTHELQHTLRLCGIEKEIIL